MTCNFKWISDKWNIFHINKDVWHQFFKSNRGMARQDHLYVPLASALLSMYGYIGHER